MIVVSHRGPFTFTEEPDGSFSKRPGAGGVVSALGPLLARRSGATWVAAAIGEDDLAVARAGPQELDGIHLHMLALDPHLHRLHYDLVSNSTLWYLHHGLFDLPRRPRFDARFREAWDGYEEVNRLFADRVCALAAADDVVLVQDYQLALVPGMLVARRPDLRVLHFTHTPFCGPNSIRVLPDYASQALCRSMAAVPCGFHSRRWARAYEASAREILGPDAPIAPAFSASLGADAEGLAATAASPEAIDAGRRIDHLVGDRKLILRTDRIEPSKNLVRGFLAYDLLLDRHPELRERVVFLALLYASRESLPEYLTYRQEVMQAAAHVNHRWSTADWEPVVLDTRDDFPRSIAGLARYDVLLVNPIKDGLNLVAKEGPLVNERAGVLCLSRDAGAFDELHEAVLPVHPFDLEQTADALHTALELPADERARRAVHLRELAAARTPAMWLSDLVTQVDAPR